MPNFNARVRTDKNKDGKTNIKIRVSHKGETRFIPTEYYIDPDYFDNTTGRVKNIHPLAGDINIELQALELTYSRKALKMEGRIKEVSINDLVLFLNDTDNQGALDFFAVGKNRIKFLEKMGKASSATILSVTMDRVRDYHGSERLPFVSINTTWLKGFESWYNINGSQNSAAIHLRNIRTLFNIALDDYGLSPEYYPFRKFKIKTQQTIHRDMSPSEIAYLMAFKPEKSFQETARDLWLLSFFLVGINFKDLLHLPKGAIKKGRIVYNRAKTGTIFSINVEPEALEIINKYKGDKYLLNILEQKQGVQITKTRKTPIYKDVTDRTNRKLKEITQAINSRVNADYLKKNGAPPAEELEVIDPGLSTYFGRHSVGSIASKLGIAHDVIREALGHSRTVTDIYINFYTPRIDAMMRQIIDEVKKELSGLTGDQPA